MSRSLRHPFGEKRIFRSAGGTRPAKAKSRQPSMRTSRFSLEAMLDAPDTTEARPGLRLRIVGIAMVGLFAVLGLRLWALQVLQAPAAAQAVVANQIRSVPVTPTRGLILDRNGNPLVGNLPTEQITLSRVAAQHEPAVIGRLAALVGKTPAEVQAAIANQQYSLYKPVPILNDAPLADIVYIKEHQAEFPGVSSTQTTQRTYPQLQLPGPAQTSYPASQVVGYVGTINTAELKSRASQGYLAGDAFGQSGLEYQYETALHGTPGRQLLEVDPKGQVAGVLKSTAPQPGANIVTNIDTNLQQVADNALATQVENLKKTFDPACLDAHDNKVGCYPGATGGAVVVMSPKTGAVYAMSSYPSYNPAVWVGGISQTDYSALSDPANNEPLINRAIAGLYTPGSTFKLNTATAALQTGLWGPETTYYDNGTFKTPGCQYNSTTCIFHNSAGDPNGTYNVSSALTVSSDDFFYNLGYLFYAQSAKYGATAIQDQAAQYSLGQLTGIDLPGEAQGRVDSQAVRVKLHAANPKAFPNTTWYTGENIEMAFGQAGTYITPIEQAVAYSTFANGGTRYAPQVAAAVVSPGGKVVTKIAPQVTGHVALSPSTFQALMTGFTGVVQSSNGTAYGAFQGLDFPGGLAGKTGTADTVKGKEPTAWFVGFGPTADPQYVVVCVIDQAGFGATAAAPVVRDVFSYLATHPIGPAAVPPGEKASQSTGAIPLPAAPASSTTTTTLPG
ncbi:MAG TPA: penicillin-binding protein 2 [Acidimicrobiales bacterium]